VLSSFCELFGASGFKFYQVFMAFEKRNGSLYYYRKERTGGRVRSIYIGSGEMAHIFAQLDAMRQDEKDFECWQRETERGEIAALDDALDLISKKSDALVTAVLLANGFHQHKRQWRRKRK
jgi:hypothetical protein